jgi:hypothetical protein
MDGDRWVQQGGRGSNVLDSSGGSEMQGIEKGTGALLITQVSGGSWVPVGPTNLPVLGERAGTSSPALPSRPQEEGARGGL